MLTFAIETSCDETSLALLRGEREVVASLVSSQIELHAAYGGVVPELAARRHLEQMNPLIEELFEGAGIGFDQVDVVGVTIGPGLVIALLVGLSAAKAFSFARGIPLVGVNHLEGHICANFLANPNLRPPLLAHIVSGGHTLLAKMIDHGRYELIGETLDDAVGEAFDKVGARLGLGYPGGPVIDELAKTGDPGAYPLPRAMAKTRDYNFSLSGVKTAVVNLVETERAKGTPVDISDLCASFQEAVFEVQIDKAIKAAREHRLERIVLAGGVSANSYLRRVYAKRAEREGIELFIPPLSLCTDNATMIASAAYYRHLAGDALDRSAAVDPNLRLPAGL